MILLPFVMLQQQNYDIDLQLNQTVNNIANTNESKLRYEQVEDKIVQLKTSTSNGADDLRMYIMYTSELYGNIINIQQNESMTSTSTAQIGGPSIYDQPEDQGHPNCKGFLPGNNASMLDNTSIMIRSKR